MTASRGKLLSTLLAVAAVLAYAVFSHYASIVPEAGYGVLAVAVVPLLVAGFGYLRQARGGVLPWLLVPAAVGLVAWAEPLLQDHLGALYFVQHVGVNGVLGVVFGRTLAAGRRPLCTFFAGFIHPRMTPALLRYTRQVTLAWTVFFAVVTGTSIGLFWLAPIEIWSVFANLLTFPLVALMFVAEALVRRRVLPPEDQLGVTSAFRAYQVAMAARRRGQGA